VLLGSIYNLFVVLLRRRFDPSKPTVALAQPSTKLTPTSQATRPRTHIILYLLFTFTFLNPIYYPFPTYTFTYPFSYSRDPEILHLFQTLPEPHSGDISLPQRHDSIIGSLVVIFPIIHAGGRYIVQHENETWSLDPCAELSGASTPAISYLALYGPEVLHAMEPVDLGYRVTLNYNLSLVDRNAGATVVPSISTATDCLLENTIRALLAEPAFLPSGGFLAVGLAHKYPIPRPKRTISIPPSITTHSMSGLQPKRLRTDGMPYSSL
jgi:hypothetical protein